MPFLFIITNQARVPFKGNLCVLLLHYRVLIELNKNGKTPNNLEEFSADFRNNLGFENSISQDSINRFDKLSLKKKKYKKAKKLNR